MIAVTIFWICAFVVLYVYVGYPALLAAGALGPKKPVGRSACAPKVSIIIPAHNEAKHIEKKLRNTAELAYPADLLEILVGSDGSTDGTANIVRKYSAVKLFESPWQIGKSSIQNELVIRSSGEVLVFTDCDCALAPDAVNALVANIADPTVGLVTARPIYVNARENDVTENEGRYLRYESWIRSQESARGLLAVASGSLFAIRRSLWTPLPPNLGDDFVLPLRVTLNGHRNVLEPAAEVRTELSQNRIRSMLAMKRRIISKDLLALMKNAAALNPLRTGRVAVALISHKLLRWIVPYLLLCLFIDNVFLQVRWAQAFLFLQIAFYAMAAMGALSDSGRAKSIWLVPASFCAVNLASALAILQCACGKTVGQWQPDRPNSTNPRSANAGANRLWRRSEASK